MNKAEAESLLKEIAQDPRIAENDFDYNMAVTGGIDGTYCAEVDFYPDPIKVFNNRDAWLKWKAEKINEVPTIEITLKDIKGIVSIIEETLQAPKALPNRKNALRDYVAQLKEASLQLGMIIESDG